MYCLSFSYYFVLFFFFNHTATTEIYTLSLHDALPISAPPRSCRQRRAGSQADDGWHWRRRTLVPGQRVESRGAARPGDRKSTRLNSSHPSISYAVFCLKKKKKKISK